MDSRIVHLKIEYEDVCKWTKDQCFRHFYIHWRNGIRSLNESPTIELQETTDHILVHDSENASAGVIKLDRVTGWLVFSGTIMPSGAELDSLHKASLGMIAHGHNVNFRGLETWEFYRRGESLSARVTGETQSETQSQSQSQGQVQTPSAQLELFKVDAETFLSWLSIATIDITNMGQPESLVETDTGDLLLDPIYMDCLYVDGVRVLSRKLGSFEFGYHYRAYDGLISTDLELEQDLIEPELRCQIWMDSVQENDDLVSIIFNLMRARPWMPDVRKFEDYLDCGTVEMMRDCMIDECQCEGYIFCSAQDDQNEIAKVTSRPPLAIPMTLWDMFYRQRLVRNWPDELIYISSRVEPPKTTYAFNISRLIVGLLLTDRDTNRCKITFVDFPMGHPSVYYHEESHTFYISDSWLDYATMHSVYPCRVSSAQAPDVDGNTQIFRCDHLVMALYECIMKAAARDLSGSENETLWVSRKCQAGNQRLLERPQMVSMREQGRGQWGVCVQWESATLASMDEFLGLGFYVVVHWGGCKRWMKQVAHFNADADTESDTAPCGCPQKTTGMKHLQAIFDIPAGEIYVPVVALNQPGTLHSVPSISPSKPEPPAEFRGITLLPSLRESWQKEKFPLLFSKFTPAYGYGLAPGRNPQFNPAATGQSSRLNFSFERHQYITVQYEEYHPVKPQLVSYVLYVYGVQPSSGNTYDEGSLVVTIYSILRTTELWQFHAGLSDEHNVGMRELLLHYWNFENMGTRQDAVVLPINRIAAVYPVLPAMLGSFESIVHTVDMPDPSRTPYYCRFAVRCGAAASNAACVMPVASHLLSHAKRWPEPRYDVHMQPSVVDLSPAFLGLAEGFSQAGCRVDAAFDFDPAVDFTWKARYPGAKLYDGPLSSIVSDIVAKALGPPGVLVSRDNPLILLLTVPDGDINTWDPARELHILQVLPALLTVLNKPDMLVVALPPWALVEQAFTKFFPIVYALLQERYAVHLKRVSVSRFGPVTGEMLVLVASCVPAPIPWDVELDSSQDNALAKLMKSSVTMRINDLNFLNPRAFTHSSGSSESLVCMHPTSGREVYNHPAGLAGSPSVTVDLNKKVTIDLLKRGVKHYERSDTLTVRELARVQGFEDSFVFLGGREKQYADVLGGVRPDIAQDVATRAVMVFREFIAPTPAPIARHMPQSGSFSAPPSVAPGSVTFTESGAQVSAPTSGSAVSETTIPGAAPAPSTDMFHASGAGVGVGAGAVPMSAPANTTSFPGPVPMPASRSVSHPVGRVPGHHPSGSDTVMAEAPGLGSSFIPSDMFPGSNVSMYAPATRAVSGPAIPASAPVSRVPSGNMPVSASGDMVCFSGGMTAPGSSNRAVSGPVMPNPTMASQSMHDSMNPPVMSSSVPVSNPNLAGSTMTSQPMNDSMNPPVMSAPASQSTFFPFFPGTDSFMSGPHDDESSSPETVSFPPRPVSNVRSAFRPSGSLSRPPGSVFLPAFNSPGGFDPTADAPLAVAQLHEHGLVPSVESELVDDFDMEEFLEELLDNGNDGKQGGQGGQSEQEEQEDEDQEGEEEEQDEEEQDEEEQDEEEQDVEEQDS